MLGKKFIFPSGYFFHSPSSDFSLEAEKKWALIVGSAMKVEWMGGGGLCGGVSMATERVGTDCALASGAEATDESLNELPRCF